jgi:hypothetical protein
MKYRIGTVALVAVGFGLAACDDGSMTETSAVAAAPSVQEQACLAAVSNETNNGEVAVLSSEFSEANSVVMIGVGPNSAPWRCLVSNDGVVAEVTSQTDEGFL